MPSDSGYERRREELMRQAPLRPRGLVMRDGGRYLLCGTIGCEFDQWQRRLSAMSAADALIAQEIGLDAVERLMDELEADARKDAERAGISLKPRRSPGYGDLPLALSREIIDRLDAARRIGVSVTSADLLSPSKSVTAICEVQDDV